jgi:hypothetical protein
MPPIVVQRAAYVAASSLATHTVTYPSGQPYLGRTLVMRVCSSGGVSVTTATLVSAGWTLRLTQTAGKPNSYWLDKIAGAAEGTTVSVPLSAAGGCCVYIDEIAGLTASSYDVGIGASASGTAITSLASGSTATTAQGDELALVMASSAVPATSVSSFTTNTATIDASETTTIGTNPPGLSIGSYVTSAVGAQGTTAAFTVASDSPEVLLACYKVAPSVCASAIQVRQAVNRSYTY